MFITNSACDYDEIKTCDSWYCSRCTDGMRSTFNAVIKFERAVRKDEEYEVKNAISAKKQFYTDKLETQLGTIEGARFCCDECSKQIMELVKAARDKTHEAK